ncbi:hypothetical protein [Sedimenticola selenatireducens]|uniref:Uncharacterized protein n=1 Tax=Sedimenticola selenatireducens TaxID=191960 RepID=A0A557SCJ9_9GAMM|nr:hypothetical protein [Sedimenticola selenatireducens]TVO75148.1 hypothetical protein FHP88_09040 [Sedimenticola selenatireducens]TVT66997.1 MAG: hypothetical protein FHK78_01315 [Sedimenticola selenatireducens]
MKTLMIMISTLSLTGCATSPFGTAASGGANYAYQKTAAGDCVVTINSARDIAGGTLMIEDDCKVTVSADTAGGAAAMKLISDLVGKIR